MRFTRQKGAHVPDSDQIRGYRDYYLSDNDGEPSIYHIWEDGSGRGNVTTPAQSSAEYRQFMWDLLRGLLAESADPGLLSLGCGNAMIEAAIAADGTRVLGVDALEEAVELARARGVDTVCADVLSWTPPPGPWPVVYADGSLGHLYDPDTGVQTALERFQSWVPEGGSLVISNDQLPDAEVTKHPDLPYYFFSESYLLQQVGACGFRDVTSTVFTYQKPVSGPRDRVVVTARA
jgi:predicted TPR repeat methyltransferase